MEDFLSITRQSLAAGRFLKLTLSKPLGPASARNLYLRLIQLKGQTQLSFLWRYAQNDITKNYPLEEGLNQLGKALETDFAQARLFSQDADYQYEKGRKTKRLPASLSQAPPDSHDRAKQYLVPENRPFLQALGLSNAQGQVLTAHRDKFRQINKFAEIMLHLVREAWPQSQSLRLADMGCGKGYLSFALYEVLSQAGYAIELMGWELRPALVEEANARAKKLGFMGLRFEAGDIAQAQLEQLDGLIALHACDTATDLALAKGIQAQAKLLVLAPCCHKQVRRELQLPKDSALEPIFRHGILAERQTEILTDALRALILEREGYAAQVFEFISPEHTSKNLLISAIRSERTNAKPKVQAQIEALKNLMGLPRHFLESLLEFDLSQ